MNQSALEMINRRQRQVLVHSFLYYQLNESIIEDWIFDRWSKDIVELRERYPDEFDKSVYADAYAEFDGSSGFDLPFALPEVQSQGYKMLDYHRKLKHKQMKKHMESRGVQ